jgi:hypothetical protein
MWQGKKTYLVAFLTCAVGVLAETDWVKVLDDPKGGFGLIAGSVLMAVMRWVTQNTTVKAAEQAPPPAS